MKIKPSNRLERALAQGEALAQQNRLEEANQVLSALIKREPGNWEAHKLFRRVLSRQGDWVRLHREFERWIVGHHSGTKAEWEKSCNNLLFGHMKEGWEQYEARWRDPGLSPRVLDRIYPQPVWKGEPFAGKTLLLRWEQGFGDAIMYVRYAPLVKARGGRVILEVMEPLVDLMATCEGLDAVVSDGEPAPEFDLQISLLSLPRVFQTELDTIPARIPYLSVPARVPHRQGLDRVLAATQGLTRIGLAWAGNPKHFRDAERSIDPVLLKPLGTIPGVVWHGFQMGGLDLPFPRIIPMEALCRSSFADTAHALSAMDLVITVDTALAHLAGALGIPVFLLVTAFPDWRWLMGRNDSPWYPTLRLYRQPEPGNWPAVIQKVVADLTPDGEPDPADRLS